MSLLPTNVRVNLFRGFDAADPYPTTGTEPDVEDVAGLLRPDLDQGRRGQADFLHWTHTLELPLGTDIRSGYHSQLQTWSPADADTVILPDYPLVGRCTAFFVVMVQRLDRGGLGDRLRAYLDRLQPRAGGCFVSGGG